jgi:spore germination cell wall hydrolase CwlJ-like protein
VNPVLRNAAMLAALSLPRLLPGAMPEASPIQPVAAAPYTVVPAIYFPPPKYVPTATERETVAACLVLEAASQGEFGMRGVMAVIRNRARGLPELFVPTVLREHQFSALNQLTAGRESLGRLIARARHDCMWPTALRIVDDALGDAWWDPTNGATHYTRTGEATRWTRSLAKTVTIGAHSFYR